MNVKMEVSWYVQLFFCYDQNVSFDLLLHFNTAGWGTIKEENSIKSHILYQVQVPVIPNDQCEKSFRAISKRVKAAQNYVIDEKYVLCAGLDDGGKDACNGDSGGPLMLPIFANGRFPYFQIGIVSYGEGCARPKIPGVYTNVLQYTDWIIDKLR